MNNICTYLDSMMPIMGNRMTGSKAVTASGSGTQYTSRLHYHQDDSIATFNLLPNQRHTQPINEG